MVKYKSLKYRCILDLNKTNNVKPLSYNILLKSQRILAKDKIL